MNLDECKKKYPNHFYIDVTAPSDKELQFIPGQLIPLCSFCDRHSVGVVYGDESSVVPTGNIYYCEDHRKDAKTWEHK